MILLEKILFYLLIFCLPWQTRKILYSWGDSFSEWASAYLYLTDVLIILILLLWIWRVRNNRFLILRQAQDIIKDSSFWLVVFLFFSLVTLIQAKNLPLSFYAWFKLLEFIGLFFYLKKNYIEIFNFKNLAKVFIASGVFQSLIAIFQFAGQQSLGLRFLTESPLNIETAGVAKFMTDGLTFIRPYGSFPHPNILAAFLLVCLVFLYYFWLVKERNFFGDCFLLSVHLLLLSALGLTFSRTVIFIFFLFNLMFFIFLFKRYKRQVLSLLLLLVVFSSLFFFLAQGEVMDRFQISSGEQAVSLRLFLNQVSFSVIQEYPLMGIGLGNFVWEIKEILNLFLDWVHQPVHNMYLLIASETGLIGLFLFLMFVYQLIRQFKKQKIENREQYYLLMLLVFCLLLLGLFDHFFWTLQQGQLIFWLILGLLAGKVFHNLTAGERRV